MMKRTANLGSKLFDVCNVLLMLLIVFITVFPLYYVLIVSISDGGAVMRGEVSFFPKGINLKTYEIVFQDSSIMRSYLNTVMYTAAGTLINLTMTALCAYPLSRSAFYGRNLFALAIVFTMFFDGGLIPRYLVVDALGLVDTVWAILLPPAISVWYLILMRTFFQSIPDAIHESAYMDGAGEFTVLTRIVVPLSVPIFATMTLFYAVWHWNSFFPALIYLSDKSMYPVQIMLRNIVIEGDMAEQSHMMGGDLGLAVTAQNIKYAVVIVVIAPIVMLYPFLQKYFVKGIMVGSIKG